MAQVILMARLLGRAPLSNIENADRAYITEVMGGDCLVTGTGDSRLSMPMLPVQVSYVAPETPRSLAAGATVHICEGTPARVGEDNTSEVLRFPNGGARAFEAIYCRNGSRKTFAALINALDHQTLHRQFGAVIVNTR